MGLTVDISKRSLTAQLDGILDQLDEQVLPPQVAEVAAFSVKVLVQGHLRKRNADRSGKSMDGARSNYWGRASELTFHGVEGDTGQVSINQPGVALHYFGGVVKPKRGKYLTIPNVPAAYGKRAKEFKDLEILISNGRAVALYLPTDQDKEAGEIDRKNIYYWLVKQTTHKADPSVLPDDDAILNEMTDTLGLYLDRLNRPETNPHAE